MYLRGPLGCQCASTVICAIFVMVLPGALKPKRMSHLFFFAAVVVLFFRLLLCNILSDSSVSLRSRFRGLLKDLNLSKEIL